MRARNFLPPLALTLLAVPAFAIWAWLPCWELIPKSDLAVVATLRDVHEWSDGERDFGEGDLVVESVIFGERPATPLLRLEWSNSSGLACPRVEHRAHEGVRALWLLNAGGTPGVVHAGYPRRFLSLADKKMVTYQHEELKTAPPEARKDPRYRAVDSLLAVARRDRTDAD